MPTNTIRKCLKSYYGTHMGRIKSPPSSTQTLKQSYIAKNHIPCQKIAIQQWNKFRSSNLITLEHKRTMSTNSQSENQSQKIDTSLVHELICSQFPQWAKLPIKPVPTSGWDNRTFRLGEDMLIRIPSAEEYAIQVEKEQFWLPKLAASLPLSIPTPLQLGKPSHLYPWQWSIYNWLEGDTAASKPIADPRAFAVNLAEFIRALQQIDTQGGPLPGEHNFYRGGPLSTYDLETRRAIEILEGKIDTTTALQAWETALDSHWKQPNVWIHGDVSIGNLLVRKGQLGAVIDFGMIGIGDPACDLTIAWTFFSGESREAFRKTLQLDDETWARGRAWALWKALIVSAGLVETNIIETTQSRRVLDKVLTDYKSLIGKTPF